jgi:hypothetical protein
MQFKLYLMSFNIFIQMEFNFHKIEIGSTIAKNYLLKRYKRKKKKKRSNLNT